jgi:adenylate cyclase
VRKRRRHPRLARFLRRAAAERQWRLASGLVLAVFLTIHLLSHAAGIVSYQWLEVARRVHGALWQNPAGTVALYGALIVHFLLALRSLHRRRTLRMPAWEAVQLIFGLGVPVLLAGHVIGTRGAFEVLDVAVDYPYVVTTLWNDGWLLSKQVVLVLLAWAHVCVGLHYWLRLRPWYPRLLPLTYPLAVCVPVLGLVGFARAGLESEGFVADEARMTAIYGAARTADPAARAWLTRAREVAPWGVLGVYLLVLGARGMRIRAGRRRGVFVVRHPQRGNITGRVGQSVLEALRAARVPHASVCGGRTRCTTCRVRVGQGLATLPPPGRDEAAALARIGAAPNVRLACQLRPSRDLDITPVLPPDAGVRQPGGVQGREQRVAAMFVDLRGSTTLGERKLPYDVVFLLNRFFEEMFAALESTGGHYAQFSGDGLLALYGLETGFRRACRDALSGSVEMSRRLRRLNAHLADELAVPLRIGIGVHAGEAIVGTMGPPASPNLSAVGDNINVAARLEQQSKVLDCALVVSATAATAAGVDLSGFPAHLLPLRGREVPIAVFAVADPEALAALLEMPA